MMKRAIPLSLFAVTLFFSSTASAANPDVSVICHCLQHATTADLETKTIAARGGSGTTREASDEFMDTVKTLRKRGKTEAQIAEYGIHFLAGSGLFKTPITQRKNGKDVVLTAAEELRLARQLCKTNEEKVGIFGCDLTVSLPTP